MDLRWAFLVISCGLVGSSAACGASSSTGVGEAEGDSSSSETHHPLDLGTPTAYPLFDAHLHSLPSWPEGRVETVAQEGEFLAVAVLGPAFEGDWQSTAPDQVFAFAFLSELDQASVDAVAGNLAAGARGVGEVSISHVETSTQGVVDRAGDDPLLVQVWQLAADYGVPVNVHCEGADVLELAAALDSSPETIFIWAHMGDTDAATVRSMLEAYPDRLYADLACRNPHYIRPPHSAEEQALTDGDGVLKPGWVELFEDYPTRLLWGTDIGPPGRYEQLEQTLDYAQSIFAQLEPSTAEAIAHSNAEALFGL